MISLLSCLVLGLAAGLDETAALPEQMQELVAESDAVTPAQLQGITAFYRDCLQIGAIGSARKTASSWTSNFMPSGLLEGNVTVEAGSSQEPDDICFDPITGEVYLYAKKKWHRDPESKKLTRKDAIPEDRAWNQALPLLKHYGLSTSRDEYRISLDDVFSPPEVKDDLYGVTWCISRKLSYDGTPCRLATIRVEVSAHTGKIVLMTYHPVVVPCETQWLISNTEAIKLVKAWLASNAKLAWMQAYLDEKNMDGVQKVIAQPNEWNPPLEPKTTSGIRDKAYYCWEVSFRIVSESTDPAKFASYDHTYGVWVRADTGEIIGGWEVY